MSVFFSLEPSFDSCSDFAFTKTNRFHFSPVTHITLCLPSHCLTNKKKWEGAFLGILQTLPNILSAFFAHSLFILILYCVFLSHLYSPFVSCYIKIFYINLFYFYLSFFLSFFLSLYICIYIRNIQSRRQWVWIIRV